MILPFFKSHYSLGKSILTLQKKDSSIIKGPDSIIDICLQHKLEEFYLVEDNMGSFLQAYDSTKDEKLSFRFGLRINVFSDRNEKHENSRKATCKYIIFAKDEEGYKKLIKIYSDAASTGFYYEPRTDFSVLREVWEDKSLVLAVPFYDSFLYRNTFEMCNCVPEFDFTRPTFLIENNELYFDSLLKEKVTNFCKNKYDTHDIKSIYYKEKDDFMAYLTVRCMNKRTTWNKPNIDHLSSDEFSFESWRNLQ